MIVYASPIDEPKILRVKLSQYASYGESWTHNLFTLIECSWYYGAIFEHTPFTEKIL